MNDYIPADKRPATGERTQIWDANIDAILLELQKEHSAHCPADLSEEPVIIWIDTSAGFFSDGRSIYCYAECQRCMRGGWTSIKEDPKYHTVASKKPRHGRR